MLAGQMIQRIETPSGKAIDVRVVEADLSDAMAWDRDVQKPFIASTDRIDAPWRWSLLYLRSALMELAVGRELAYLQLVCRGPDGDAVVLGQVLLANGFPYPAARGKSCVFLWYLAAAPSSAVRAAGVEPVRGMLAATIDMAIQFSHLAGFEGRVCLHASPAGTGEQRRALIERYERSGLQRLRRGGLVGRLRRNDGRYFAIDESLAARLTAQLDFLR